jgi:hypothetical protein
MQTVGTRAQVMHGTAIKTSGGLKKGDLKYNSSGHIVSRKVSALAKQQQKLKKAGYTTVKGQFGAVKIGSKNMKGGGNFYMILYKADPRIYVKKTHKRLKEVYLGIIGPKQFARQSSFNPRKVKYESWARPNEIASYLNSLLLTNLILSKNIKFINKRLFRYEKSNLYIHLTVDIPRNLVGYGNEDESKIDEIKKIINTSLTENIHSNLGDNGNGEYELNINNRQQILNNNLRRVEEKKRLQREQRLNSNGTEMVSL